MDIKHAIAALSAGRDLAEAEMEQVMDGLMDGTATPAQVAAVLVALRMKGERVAELVGAARALRRHATPVATTREVVDTCGTGGDGRDTFNISTAATFIVAAASDGIDGFIARAARTTPEMRPPPPIATTRQSSCGCAASISRPIVPCPAITRRSS